MWNSSVVRSQPMTATCREGPLRIRTAVLASRAKIAWRRGGTAGDIDAQMLPPGPERSQVRGALGVRGLRARRQARCVVWFRTADSRHSHATARYPRVCGRPARVVTKGAFPRLSPSGHSPWTASRPIRIGPIVAGLVPLPSARAASVQRPPSDSAPLRASAPATASSALRSLLERSRHPWTDTEAVLAGQPAKYPPNSDGSRRPSSPTSSLPASHSSRVAPTRAWAWSRAIRMDS